MDVDGGCGSEGAGVDESGSSSVSVSVSGCFRFRDFRAARRALRSEAAFARPPEDMDVAWGVL